MARSKIIKKALAALHFDLFIPEIITPPAPATVHTKIAEHQKRGTKNLPGTVEISEFAELPTIAELQRMFDQLNWTYYDGKLPEARIKYSNRMLAAGSYSKADRLITIGRKYHEKFPEDIIDTLKHEMIHIIHFKHDKVFKKEALRLGTSVRAKFHPELRRPPKYIYACPGCGKEYPRQKKLRMSSCGNCSGSGKFDLRFKLKLTMSKS